VLARRLPDRCALLQSTGGSCKCLLSEGHRAPRRTQDSTSLHCTACFISVSNTHQNSMSATARTGSTTRATACSYSCNPAIT
jgi:hypothetical protein